MGVASALDVHSLFFIIKRNWFCVMTRHDAGSNLNMLLTRNLPNDPGDRQWSHPLMILLHCLWAKSNNKTHGQFECDMTWFCFYFDCCLFTCTVQLLFHSSLEVMKWGLIKIGCQRSREWKNVGPGEGGGGLEN